MAHDAKGLTAQMLVDQVDGHGQQGLLLVVGKRHDVNDDGSMRKQFRQRQSDSLLLLWIVVGVRIFIVGFGIVVQCRRSLILRVVHVQQSPFGQKQNFFQKQTMPRRCCRRRILHCRSSSSRMQCIILILIVPSSFGVGWTTPILWILRLAVGVCRCRGCGCWRRGAVGGGGIVIAKAAGVERFAARARDPEANLLWGVGVGIEAVAAPLTMAVVVVVDRVVVVNVVNYHCSNLTATLNRTAAILHNSSTTSSTILRVVDFIVLVVRLVGTLFFGIILFFQPHWPSFLRRWVQPPGWGMVGGWIWDSRQAPKRTHKRTHRTVRWCSFLGVYVALPLPVLSRL